MTIENIEHNIKTISDKAETIETIETVETLSSGAGDYALGSTNEVTTHIKQIMDQGSNIIDNSSAIVKQSEITKEQVAYLSQQANEFIQQINGIQEQITAVSSYAANITNDVNGLSGKLASLSQYHNSQAVTGSDPFMLSLTVFALACFIGYYVVWKVTPALHTPLMSLTNSVSGIIVIGALLSASAASFSFASALGLIAVFFASINIFGGFVVTERMLEMFKQKDKGKGKDKGKTSKKNDQGMKAPTLRAQK